VLYCDVPPDTRSVVLPEATSARCNGTICTVIPDSSMEVA
jgi:hypothetical protein